MIKIYAYICLLSALSVVEMKILNINGRVGESVTFKCSDWGNRIDVTYNDKYFCDSPCTYDKHIITKAAFGKTTNKNRIELTNRAEGLFVTFTNLQKSDSKTYYCGVKRTVVRDPLIKVNLQVTDAVSSSPKTTPKTVLVVSPLSFAVTSSSSMSSHSSDIITETSTSYTTLNTTTPSASATQGAGSVPYLVIGVVVVITILMVFLKIMSKMMKTKQKVVSSADTPQEDARGDVEYDEIRPEDQADPDCLYANYSHHQDTELAAESGNSYSNDVSLKSASRFEANSRGACAESRVIYSVAQLPEEQIEPTVQSEPNQSESYENDLLYSMAELPQAT
ncbi:uncharacterized protein LOC141764957 [Sebastes fasciatus]|uniref:uncharacterized protein LOC141764957 n=1 Tax=Sebastes fasciatus TaxID=394691 RepID=UPI003D9E8569